MSKKTRIFSQHRLIELMRYPFENEIPYIKFKDVSFSYPGKKENLIFKCNFSIKETGFWMVVVKTEVEKVPF